MLSNNLKGFFTLVKYYDVFILTQIIKKKYFSNIYESKYMLLFKFVRNFLLDVYKPTRKINLIYTYTIHYLTYYEDSLIANTLQDILIYLFT